MKKILGNPSKISVTKNGEIWNFSREDIHAYDLLGFTPIYTKHAEVFFNHSGKVVKKKDLDKD